MLIAALVVLTIFSSCSGTGESTGIEQVGDDFISSFEFSPAELAALQAGDESNLGVAFGDPGLGAASYEAPPSLDMIAALQGQTLGSGSRSASTYGSWGKCKKHKKYKCGSCKPEPPTCDPKPCLKIRGICNVTERFWKVGDFCNPQTNVTYSAKVEFEGAKTGDDLSGVEVVFSRDGVEVGRANTDATGTASFTDNNVARGPHKVTVCVKEGRTGDCKTGGKCADSKCPSYSKTSSTYGSGTDEACKPTITATFTKTSVTVTSSKDLSNIVLKFCDDSTQKFDCLSGKTGTFYGTGKHNGKSLKGAWVKSGCNSSGDGPGYGQWFANPSADCKPTNDCGCPKPEQNCTTCVYTASEGKFCATIDYAVYSEEVAGAITGNGYFPSCNPLRVGLRDGMNFRIAVENGVTQGYLNYSAGQYAGAPKVVNGQVKWAVISGTEAWFGGDTFLVHVIDAGPNFREDYFEIWINDPATCTNYCCGGKLTGCYVHVSYKWTAPKCP
jgi:hypothetical protein